jgi:hypothetical protein
MSGPSAVLKFGENSPSPLASSAAKPNPPNFKFERPDWALFRNVEGLCQKGGVTKNLLRRLVLKELTDNALDVGAKVEVTEPRPDIYVVRDFGPGIDGAPEHIARLFSINRPLVSSKLLRMPQRGALGNGLRVVTGAVTASGGRLVVSTRNRRMMLTPQDDGSTSVESETVDFPVGTMIEIEMGSDIPFDPNALDWALHAVAIAANGGPSYNGKSSPYWYDGGAFFELLQGAGDRPVRDLVASLDGCTGAKAGTVAANHKNVSCNSLGRDDAVKLLLRAREHSKAVRPERLGSVGPRLAFTGYAIRKGAIDIGGRVPQATIPFVVEAWAVPAGGGAGDAKLLINGTPSVSELKVYFGKDMRVFGCGLGHRAKVAKGEYKIEINIIAPHFPITNDGKSPDLSLLVENVVEAMQKAINGAHRAMPATPVGERPTQKSIVLANLDAAIDKASGGRKFRFNPRQIYYVLRPIVQAALGVALSEGNFAQIITDYETEHGDIKLMYRDPRGTLYHPHIGQDISLGTIAVEQYKRPEWTFNKILYIEKEGWFETLKDVRWPERNDCALLTSKGFSTRAVRDLLDLLGDDPEPITVFCIHDADAAGGLIYQTLQGETKARGRRRVEVINLGLEPWEAIEMGLDVETIEKRDRASPVPDYITDREDGAHWCGWLQRHRVELNAMSTPQFIAWLDSKMLGHRKIVPPSEVISMLMSARLEEILRTEITDRILEEADVDQQVADALVNVEMPDIENETLHIWLEANQGSLWKTWVDDLAAKIAVGAA